MNKFVLFAAAAAVLVGGCSTIQPAARNDNNVDVEKVAAIDRVTHSLGIEVHWINYPQRRGIVTDPGAPTGT
jgi:hypothetical protein